MAKSKKDKWVASKISKLIREGKDRSQAAAIAFSMYEQSKKKRKKKK